MVPELGGAFTRRDLLRAAGVLGAAGAVGSATLGSWPGRLPMAAAADGPSPLTCALHVHSSFSEGDGSMEAQLAMAAGAGVDVLWFTDHDWRLSQFGYRRVIHFDAMSENEDGLPNRWVRKASGSFASASGTIVSSPVSPLDPSGGKALRITGTTAAKATAFSYNRYLLDDTKARQNVTGTLAGVELDIEVLPQSISSDAFTELLVVTSFKPARSGRPAGRYQISYRIGGPDAPGTYRLAGTGTSSLTGIVVLPAAQGSWQSLRLDPTADIAALWPDLEAPRDAALVGLYLGVASRHGAVASSVFDYLRFSRSSTGSAAVDVQRQISAQLAPLHPGITQHSGLEVSLTDGHVNWFGGAVAPFDYSGQKLLPPSKSNADLMANIAKIHQAGGLASFNHMFGSGTGPAASQSVQDTRRAAMARMLLDTRVLGADMLEIYRRRNGIDMAHHLQAWDVCSRNGIFVTGTGVNDNHGGRSWATELNNFVTWTWAASASEADLMAAFAAGRTYFGDQVAFRGGRLDLLVDDVAPMGSVSTSDAGSRNVRVMAGGLPNGSAIRVVQGAVDYANTTAPSTLSSSTLPASQFGGGSVDVPVSNSTSSFVRLEVVNGSGATIAASNPAWLLRTGDEPPNGIPTSRAVS